LLLLNGARAEAPRNEDNGASAASDKVTVNPILAAFCSESRNRPAPPNAAIISKIYFQIVSIGRVVDNTGKMPLAISDCPMKMHRFLVNIKSAHIFNRVFEVHESAQNGENLTKIGAFETRRSAFTISALTMPRRLRIFTLF
jgi:hypothetical protein